MREKRPRESAGGGRFQRDLPSVPPGLWQINVRVPGMATRQAPRIVSIKAAVSNADDLH